jgi:uncharacterized protein YbjT (DUF2867 family)
MILVTGATGNLGHEVSKGLSALNADYRIGTLSANRQGPPELSNQIHLDFTKPETFLAAIDGCSAIFLLRPPAISNVKATLIPFLDVARQNGVAQIVFISVAGAGDNPIVPHHAVEQHLRHGPIGWTIIRPSFFCENLGSAYRQDICEDNRLYVPAGSGRVAFIAARDIGEVAVMALIAPQLHDGKTYTLTGPEALSFAHVAQLLTSELDRKIDYHPANILGYFRHLLSRHLPVGQAIIQTLLHTGLRFGQAEVVTDTLGNLLGRSPTTMQSYIRDHLELWAKERHNGANAPR